VSLIRVWFRHILVPPTNRLSVAVDLGSPIGEPGIFPASKLMEWCRDTSRRSGSYQARDAGGAREHPPPTPSCSRSFPPFEPFHSIFDFQMFELISIQIGHIRHLVVKVWRRGHFPVDCCKSPPTLCDSDSRRRYIQRSGRDCFESIPSFSFSKRM